MAVFSARILLVNPESQKLSTFENRCKDKEVLFYNQIKCFKNMFFSIKLSFLRRKGDEISFFMWF